MKFEIEIRGNETTVKYKGKIQTHRSTFFKKLSYNEVLLYIAHHPENKEHEKK